MPELPEVETVRRGLEPAIGGKTVERVVLTREGLRAPFPKDFSNQLEGKTIQTVRRRAKYLLFELSGKRTLIAHLGMTGRFTVMNKPPTTLEKHDHAVFYFTDGTALIFNDARRFGLMTLCDTAACEEHPLLAALGPEPLDNAFTPDYLAGRLSAKSAPVKVVLMDQAVVVGVGNIYASEALFRSHIHPALPAKEAARSAEILVSSIRDVLNDALASGGSSLRDFMSVGGETGYFQHQFQVYGREGEACVTCTAPLRKIVQGGRSTFFCGSCQPLVSEKPRAKKVIHNPLDARKRKE